MDIHDLVRALLSYDTIAARQWVADATRARIDWARVQAPTDLDAVAMAVAAGLVELLAERSGQAAPQWTVAVAAAPEPVFLVRAARVMPRLRRECEEEAPLPLRRRRILAPKEFLTAA